MDNGSEVAKTTGFWGRALRFALATLLVLVLVSAASIATASRAYASDTATAFATRLYTAVFDREPDASGLAAQVSALGSGWEPAEIAYNYFNSEEYFAKHESAEQTVKRLYQVMFGRDADEAGKTFWAGYLESGMSVRSVVAGFSEAQEYKEYFGGAGLNAATIPVYDSNADKAWDNSGNLIYSGGNGRDLNRGATEFAKRMYTVVLGREDSIGAVEGIDIAGLNVQAGAIANGTPCWEIASNFFGSLEFDNFGYTNNAAVAIAYEAILGRTGSSDEVSWWVTKKESSCYSMTDVVLHFCNSDEFNDLCGTYGLTSGMRGSKAASLPTARTHTIADGVCTHCACSEDRAKAYTDGPTGASPANSNKYTMTGVLNVVSVNQYFQDILSKTGPNEYVEADIAKIGGAINGTVVLLTPTKSCNVTAILPSTGKPYTFEVGSARDAMSGHVGLKYFAQGASTCGWEQYEGRTVTVEICFTRWADDDWDLVYELMADSARIVS